MSLRTVKPWHVDAAGAGVALLMAGLVYISVVVPRQNQAEYVESQRQRLEALSAEEQQAAKQLSNAREALELAKGMLDASPLRLQPSDAVNERIGTLASGAAKALPGGITLAEVSPGIPTLAPRFTRVPIRLSGSGDFAACLDLLAHIHENLPDTAVAGFKLSGNPQDPTSPTALMLDFVWYAAPAESAGSAAGAGSAAAEATPKQ